MDRSRAAAGRLLHAPLAHEWLDAVLVRARAGTLPGAVRTGATFDDACAEYLRFLEHDRQRKPSTIRDAGSIVRNHLLPAFGGRRVEDVSVELVERWARELGRDRPLSNRSKQKIIVVFHGLMERARRVWKLDANPVRDVDRPRTAASAGGIGVFSPDEVFALVRHADDEQDGALFLLAAFTGLRQGELIALRWRDVDFPREHLRVTASYTTRGMTSPKSGRVRSVPLASAAASALARLSQREHWTGDDDLVFPGVTGTYLDASALLKRYKRALRRRRRAAAALPRPAPHVRHDDDPQGRHRPRADMDGPRGHRDNAQVRALRSAPGRRTARRRGPSPAIAYPLTFPNTGLLLRSKHPKKDVEAALQDAEAKGFRVETGRGHWVVMYCPGLDDDRCPAPFWIWSTPANAANHAKQIRRYVARCPHH